MMSAGVFFCGRSSPATSGLHLIAHGFARKKTQSLLRACLAFGAVSDQRSEVFGHMAIVTKKRLKALRGFAKFSGRTGCFFSKRCVHFG